MAEVYLAEQGALQRQVAIKVLKPELATDQNYIHRFQREAQAAAALVHANIVQIHEVGYIDGVHFIAQEYVQGLNLKQWIARNGPADLRTALAVMQQVAAALAKAAERGIVHRDIKPENIMITSSGEVKVADFGLARVPARGDSVELTQAGITMGTPLYMSPEQVEGKTLDCRSDIYSFGVTCYHMLAGRPPFEGETAFSVAIQHLKKNPEPLEQRRPDLPRSLCRIVHRMLAKPREQRYQTPSELLRDLRQVARECLGEDAADLLPAVDLGLSAAGELALEAPTQRLQAAMKVDSKRWSGAWLAAVWAMVGFAAFASGAGIAFWVFREEPLFSDNTSQPLGVAKKDSIGAQVLYALHVGSKEAWEAVIRYYPQETYYVLRAKKQLAWLALMEGDDRTAMQLFQDLASLDQTEAELRAFGLAGQYWILSRQRQYAEAAEVLDQLLPLQRELEDVGMQQLLRGALAETLERSRQVPGAEMAEKWRDWLERQTATEGTGPSLE